MKAMLTPIVVAVAMAAAPGAATQAIAQDYPSETIRLIVPYPPGGSTDTVARIWADGVSRVLGEQILVENHPGAATNIGSEMVARAEPDGHTLLVGSFANAVNPGLQPDMPFDALTDLRPITLISSAPNILVVHPDVPAETLEEFIAYVRERPGEVDYGSGGIGSSAHMTVELLKNMAEIDMLNIPYRGGAAALVDLLNGQVSLIADMPQTLLEHIEAGNARPLAVTGSERHPALPDVPTVAEAGVEGFDVVAWHGIMAPGGTPDEIADRLHQATLEALDDPQVRDRLTGLGLDPRGTSPAEFGEFFHAQVEQWARVIEEADIRPE